MQSPDEIPAEAVGLREVGERTVTIPGHAQVGAYPEIARAVLVKDKNLTTRKAIRRREGARGAGTVADRHVAAEPDVTRAILIERADRWLLARARQARHS